MSDAAPTTSWVVLTMGDRPAELRTAVDSIMGQTAAPDEVIVIGNGADPGPVPGARVEVLAENLGVAGGRNHGAELATGEILFFLDDDATCAGTDLAARVVEAFASRPELAVVSFRITDPVAGRTARRHVPRLRAGRPERSSDVTTYLGGACAIRAADFRSVGGYPAGFGYAMEETDLAWRLLDRGRAVHYLGSVAVHHPATEPTRHGHAFVSTARNRVWLARRRLPAPLTVLYLAVWSVLMIVRAPSMAARRDVLRGLLHGTRRRPPAPVEPMSWRTVARMTRLGRPPVI